MKPFVHYIVIIGKGNSAQMTRWRLVMYVNRNFSVVGVSTTLGKTRVHTVNVGLNFYDKGLRDSGRTKVKLIKLPESLPRWACADAALELMTDLTEKEVVALRDIAQTNRVPHYRGFVMPKRDENGYFVKKVA